MRTKRIRLNNKIRIAMKKLVKKTLSGIGIVFLCLIIIGHIVRIAMKPEMEKASQRLVFEKMVERANRNCPIPLAMGNGAVDKIKLENSYITYYISYSSDFINVLSQLDENKVKEGLLMCFLCLNAQNNNGNIMMDLLVKYNCGIRVVITESAKGRFDFSASVDEIKMLREKYKYNPQEAMFNLLSISVEAERLNLPMIVETGMIMTDYKLEEGNIVIVFDIDEDIYSIDEMNANGNLIKASILEEGVNNPDSRSLYEMCKISHTGLIYRMCGNQSYEIFEIKITSDEIRRVVKTPSNVNIQ